MLHLVNKQILFIGCFVIANVFYCVFFVTLMFLICSTCVYITLVAFHVQVLIISKYECLTESAVFSYFLACRRRT